MQTEADNAHTSTFQGDEGKEKGIGTHNRGDCFSWARPPRGSHLSVETGMEEGSWLWKDLVNSLARGILNTRALR